MTLRIAITLLAGLFLFTALSSLEISKKGDGLSSDSLKVDREKHISAILESIKGRENLPADSVFKNIQGMKGVPAGRLLRIMDVAYSQSLGVSCGHCHNSKKWESDEKREKQLAREMAKMTRRINNELLKDISGLSNATINCTTCHRGAIKPALSLQ